MAIPDTDQFKSFIREGQAGYEAPLGQLGIVEPGKVKYDPRHHSYAHDLYQYYLGGGMPPAGAAGITTQVPGTTVQGTGGGVGGAGITAAGVPTPVITPSGQLMDPTMMIPQTGTRVPSAGISYEDDLVGVQPGFPMTDLEIMARESEAARRLDVPIAPTTVGGVTMKGRTTEGGIPGTTLPTIDLEPMAREYAATDPRYAADVKSGIIDESPWAGQETTTMKGRTLDDAYGLYGYAPEFRDFDTTEQTQYQVPFEGARTIVGVPIPSEAGLMMGDTLGYGMDEVQPTTPTVTGIEGPPSIISDPFTPTGPTMADVAGPVQNITLPSGDVYAANDPQLLEKVDPETRTNTNVAADLWNKAKGSVADFKTSLTDSGKFSATQIGSIMNAFANPSAVSLAGAAGIPGLIIGALAGAGTQVSPEQRAANAAFEAEHGINVGDDGRITSGPLQGKVPAGKSFAGSATYEEMIDKKIDSIKTRKAPQTDASREKIAELEALKGPETRDQAIDAGIAAADIDPADVGVEAAGVDFSADRTPENIAKATKDLADQYDREVEAGERPSDETVTSDVNKAKAVIDMPSHLGDVGQGDPMGRDDPTPPGSTGHIGHPSGGTAGDSGGKIVCTMMNDSYGFGSFRNKIWLRQSKTLPMEYQLGYHALFLPLVKFSKREGLINKAVKKVLEHIAVHRTIDIRQEARGKTHMLGRVYRKILEPICYWVGKYGKRT